MATGLERTAVDPMTGRVGRSPKIPQGVTRTAVDPLQALLRQSAEFPQYGALVDYLSARRMMPPIEQRPMGVSGSFDVNSIFGRSLPRTGVVNIGMRSGPDTVVHELTHAADNQLASQYTELLNKRGELTPAERQFMQAFEKLSYDKFGRDKAFPRKTLAEKLDPEWVKKEREYRSTNAELPAWAMGATVEPRDDYSPPLHLNPTLATEFLMLMELARRAQPVIPGR